MAQGRFYEPTTSPSNAWAGWITFAAVTLTLLGTLNMSQGFIALGWGLMLIAAGLAVVAGRGWARWFAVFAVFVNVIAQIGFMSADPIWSAIMILLDVLVLFALTGRWSEARAAM